MPPEEVLVASTGVIGVDLDLQKVTDGVTKAARRAEPSDGITMRMLAIMTTDPFPKETAVTSRDRLPGRFMSAG